MNDGRQKVDAISILSLTMPSPLSAFCRQAPRHYEGENRVSLDDALFILRLFFPNKCYPSFIKIDFSNNFLFLLFV